MQYIIRTIENGKRFPLEKIDEKRVSIKEKILESGMQYIEHEAIMGSYNELGQRIEERVYVISAQGEVNYV